MCVIQHELGEYLACETEDEIKTGDCRHGSDVKDLERTSESASSGDSHHHHQVHREVRDDLPEETPHSTEHMDTKQSCLSVSYVAESNRKGGGTDDDVTNSHHQVHQGEVVLVVIPSVPPRTTCHLLQEVQH